MPTTGSYDLTVDTPFGAQHGRLDLDLTTDRLTGRLATASGTSELDDGSVDGDAFTFTTRLRTPMGRMKATVTGTVDGDTLTASARLPLGRAAIHGTRVEG
ncbi:MAG: hypothetical protein KQH57_16800 [Actinomycetales bacterium]|nr:hypothetical protein [Actinomycetales bacterium]